MAIMKNVRIIPASETKEYQAHVIATINGTDKIVIKYYDDELTFHPSDFENKDESEAWPIFCKKDVEYLQS